MSYEEVKSKITSTLTGRESGTQITPESHEEMATTILDYIEEKTPVATSDTAGVVKVGSG